MMKRTSSLHRSVAVLLAILCTASSGIARADEAPPEIVAWFAPGKWVEGEKKFAAAADDQTKFGLGILRILTAFDRLAKGLYQHGFLNVYARNFSMRERMQLFNPNSRPINDRQAGDLLRQFTKDLEAAEATLAQVKDANVKLRVPMGRVLLQFQSAYGSHPLLQLTPLAGAGRAPAGGELDQMTIVFDEADVSWLRGYCHILLAVAEIINACDSKEWFDRTAHLVFPKVDGPYPFLKGAPKISMQGFGDTFFFIDLAVVAARADAPVAEPERLRAAHGHLKSVLAMSRQMWKEIQAETDDDHEWIPSAAQKSAPFGAQVTQEMIDAWLAMTIELDAVLDGRLLVPFWRGDGRQGINMKRVFLESKRISVVDWVQGTAAAGYLEQGPQAGPRIWRRLLEVFGDNMFNYAVWFN